MLLIQKNINILLTFVISLLLFSNTTFAITTTEQIISYLKTNPITLKENIGNTSFYILQWDTTYIHFYKIIENEFKYHEKESFDFTTISNFIEGKGKITFKSGVTITSNSPLLLTTINKLPHFNIPITIYNNKNDNNITNKKEENVVLRFILDIASVNTYNLWDNNPNNTSEEQLYIYDIYRPPFSNYYKDNIFEKKCDSMISLLKLIGIPEIVALQELESANGEAEILSPKSYFRSKLTQLGYNYFYLGHQEKKNPTAITTGFISKYPLKPGSIPFNVELSEFSSLNQKEKNVAHYTTRDIQTATLSILNYKLHIYNNHWRSQGCSSPWSCSLSERIRITNAVVLKNAIIKNDHNENDVILLGDFNTAYWMLPLQTLGSTGDETNNSFNYFYNLWYELPENKRYESAYSGRGETLSHILIGPKLYDNAGINYFDNSYRVGGQQGPAAHYLTNSDGNPLRFQDQKLKLNEIPQKQRAAIEKVMQSRGCDKKAKKKKRNCKASFTKFYKYGFSDHLPIIASFSFIGEKLENLKGLAPSSKKDISNPPIIDTVISECRIEKSIEVNTIDINDKSNFKRCIKLSTKSKILTEGIYNSPYIKLNDGNHLGIAMTRGFDPRAITNGLPSSDPTQRKMDPKSNMCFLRKVLQGDGGAILKAFGRLGFANGKATLFISRREYIVLTDLPLKKQKACSYKKSK